VAQCGISAYTKKGGPDPAEVRRTFCILVSEFAIAMSGNGQPRPPYRILSRLESGV
jgi:hypothetical protein